MLLTPPISTLFPYTTLFRSYCARVILEFRELVGESASTFQKEITDERQVKTRARRNHCPGAGRDHWPNRLPGGRSEEHTSELQSQSNLVCRLLLEKKN